ncbi:MAG: dihydrofolate reductase family protein [Psychrobium sp.]
MSNIVFIATSLDGYIADKNNEVDWLHLLPPADDTYMNFEQHMSNIDALVMGRNTYELVAGFDGEWPYSKPVFVLSNTINNVADKCRDKVTVISGEPDIVVERLRKLGYKNLYIDGGVTIQNFLQHDLIDEMIITIIPVLLGGGIPLFGVLDESIMFKGVASHCDSAGVMQQHFVRRSE